MFSLTGNNVIVIKKQQQQKPRPDSRITNCLEKLWLFHMRVDLSAESCLDVNQFNWWQTTLYRLQNGLPETSLSSVKLAFLFWLLRKVHQPNLIYWMNVYNTEVDMYLSHHKDHYANLWDILCKVFAGTGCWPTSTVTVFSHFYSFFYRFKISTNKYEEHRLTPGQTDIRSIDFQVKQLVTT